MERKAGTSYEQFVTTALDLGFFDDMEQADAAVKMVLGIAASRLDEASARLLADKLPEPLTYEKLRSHQVRATNISAAQYLHDIAREFGISDMDAREAIQNIWSLAIDAMGDETTGKVVRGFPPDWRALLELVPRSPGIWG